MVVDVGSTLTAQPQRGSVIDTGGKIVKVIFWVLLIIVLLLLYALAAKLADYGATLDPSTWDEAAQSWLEASGVVEDTGQSGGGAFLSAAWYYTGGTVGGLFGLGTTKAGFAGIGESWGKGKNAQYTWIKRLFGG